MTFSVWDDILETSESQEYENFSVLDQSPPHCNHNLKQYIGVASYVGVYGLKMMHKSKITYSCNYPWKSFKLPIKYYIDSSPDCVVF
jgi:hypothetical protein